VGLAANAACEKLYRKFFFDRCHCFHSLLHCRDSDPNGRDFRVRAAAPSAIILDALDAAIGVADVAINPLRRIEPNLCADRLGLHTLQAGFCQ
jgi:hypothetical protein